MCLIETGSATKIAREGGNRETSESTSDEPLDAKTTGGVIVISIGDYDENETQTNDRVYISRYIDRLN